MSASSLERFAGFGAADASERLEDCLLRQPPLSGTEHQIVNGQQARDCPAGSTTGRRRTPRSLNV